MMVLLIISAFAEVLSGQKIMPSPGDLYREAGEYMIAGDYNEALPLLLNLLDKGYSGPNISYRIGECYLNIPGQKLKAIPYLQEATTGISGSYTGDSLDEGKAPVKSLLYLGISYRLNYDFDKALASFNEFLLLPENKDIGNQALARYHINRCYNARELIAAPAQFSTDTLPVYINTMFSSSNPLITEDEKRLFYMDQLKFYDAIMISAKGDSIWEKPENMTSVVGSDGDHVITGISADGNELLMTVYDPYLSGEIYMVRIGEAGMQKLNGNINTRFNESHASYSPDGRYLYFTSDRTGGFGGLDIYRSERDAAGNWGVAENLGPMINSVYNEETPFVSGDSKWLFFSSQGHYNMGGYDVFMSSRDGSGNWFSPVNLGYPVNTTDDDLFYFPLGEGKIAYQARFFPSTATSHIIRYDISSFGNPARYSVLGQVNLQGYPGFETSSISVRFSDSLSGGTVSIKKLNMDGSFTQKLPSGNFAIDFVQNDSILMRKNLLIPDYFPMDELILHTDLMVTKPEEEDSLFLKDILFAFNRSGLEEKYLQMLEGVAELMSAHPGFVLAIHGYADSRGNQAYNRKLSLARANAVAGYLKKYISLAGRITVNGFGEENPVAIDRNADGTDNPAGRMYNRRVELILDHGNTVLNISRLNEIPPDLRIR